MTFYDCQETICKELNNHIHNVRVAKGLTVMEVIKQRREIAESVKDVYSSALLATGLKYEQAPTFSNVPNTSYTSFFRDNLEEVFKVLGWSTTQHEVHRIAGQLRKKTMSELLTDEQKESLENLDWIKNDFAKISEWLIRARNIVVTMCSNFPLLQSVTEEEKELAAVLSSFDWYYSYSDQSSTYRNGESRHIKAGKKVKEILAEKPHLQKVVDTVSRAHGFGQGFFTFTG